MLFKTRDPNPDEARRYNDAMMAIEEARLAQREFDAEMRRKYVLPQDVNMDSAGVFLHQGKPYRKKAKPGAPDRIRHKACPEEVDTLNQIRAEIDLSNNAKQRMLHELRKACDAPHYAQLNSEFRWFAMDDPRQGPRLLAETTPQEDEDEDAQPE